MDRDELHMRIKLLKEEMEAGHIQIPPELQHEMNASLLKIRYVEDGMVDPATVDSRVRAMALAVLVIHEDEELKEKRSLKEIQGAYFEFLESFFGKSFREMKQKGLAPPDIAQQMASNTNLVRVLYSRGEEFFSGIQTFWRLYNGLWKWQNPRT